MAAKSFKDLIVWQVAHELVLTTYRLTESFPREERYGIVSQMRRAAVSIAANIAEGFKRKSARDKANFYVIAEGSLEESHYYWILTKDLGYITQNQDPLARIASLERLLSSLIRATLS